MSEEITNQAMHDAEMAWIRYRHPTRRKRPGEEPTWIQAMEKTATWRDAQAAEIRELIREEQDWIASTKLRDSGSTWKEGGSS